ncbi:fibrobacter succinogenes major paralogous domain-containing protein [uncultured Fibrobacter sp.]|uniref:fibrobacter succinogenes major paralogous domain-containing protein n=1 Tax=uncultured Fibrobacter sp. TaxID=261512 RepID=UPI0025E02DEB|nr:fibrobacter succinogenes major paralogous domain-containing protein [uncultured Fibrobacter sp.]
MKLKISFAVFAAIFFAACGDTVENINQMGMLVADSEGDLPKCSKDKEGEQAVVKGETSIRVCIDGAWMAMTSEGSGNGDFSCKTEELKDKSGLKIVCNGDSIGVVLNGEKGKDGADGKDGEDGVSGTGCSINDRNDTAIVVVCGDSTMTIDFSLGVKKDTADADTGDNDIEISSFVKSVTLDRYHILNSDRNKNILVEVVVDSLSKVDTSGGIYVQMVYPTLDTVVNFRPHYVKNDTIKAIIVAPKDTYAPIGKEYEVCLKIGENVYKDYFRRFNVSGSYSNLKINAPSKINIDKAAGDSFSVSISGNNLDFIGRMSIHILDKERGELLDSVAVDLKQVQWLSDTCKNAQEAFVSVPMPPKEGLYSLDLYVNENNSSTVSSDVLAHKDPYFTLFEIPSADIVLRGSVTANLWGKNFVRAGLNVSQLNLTFSDEYQIIDALKYKASIAGDSLIYLEIYTPQMTGEYDVSAHYGNAYIQTMFNVSCSREGMITNVGGIYYICKSEKLVEATTLEYNTTGFVCNNDGFVFEGLYDKDIKYVCDNNEFREAGEMEVYFEKGCINYTEGIERRKKISKTLDSIYTCLVGEWTGSGEKRFASMLDDRDGKIYRIVPIGSQIWMAENLNYSDSASYPGLRGRSWCYENEIGDCAKNGRLYTWAAAMDSAGTWSTNGMGCGFEKSCIPTYPVRGICPEGWHLPSQTEWETLFAVVGGDLTAGDMLKSARGWNDFQGIDGNGSDNYSFAAQPTIFFYGGSFVFRNGGAFFWNSTEVDSDSAYYASLSIYDNRAHLGSGVKDLGISVRCIQDD